MKEKLFYFDTVNHKITSNRSYAIHLLKQNHTIRVYHSRTIDNDSYVETWVDYIPKHNNVDLYYGYLLEATNKNCIIGYYHDKHHNCVVYAKMSAIKDNLYLKDAEELFIDFL